MTSDYLDIEEPTQEDARKHIIDLVGDENGTTQRFMVGNKEITITRSCPAHWKCKRCGNVYPQYKIPFSCECRSKDFDYEIPDFKDFIDFLVFNQDYASLLLPSLTKWNKDKGTDILTEMCKAKYPFFTTRHDELAEIWTYETGIYVPNGKTFIREYSRKMLGENYNAFFSNLVIQKVEADTYIESQKFFDNNIVDELPCENGLLNLKTRELLSFNERKIHFIKIPVIFDKEATCPKIDAFFKSLLTDDNDVQTVYELIGYCLWKTYKLEKAAVLLGEGSNGKDTLLEIVKRFLGAYNTKSISLTMLEKDDFAESELFQKLANLSGELSKTAIREDSKFKALTGRSQLSASRKFKEKITFVNFSKQIFAANSLPKVNDMTDGFWRRWIYLQFPYKFETQDVIDKMKADGLDVSKMKLKNPDIVEGICTQQEFSGLLNKSLDAIAKVFERRAFTSSKSNEETSMFWVRKSDSFLAFAIENIEQNPESFVLKETVRKAYQKYCKKNKVGNETDKHMAKIMQTQFGAMDARKMFDGTQEYIWEGVQLKDSLL